MGNTAFVTSTVSKTKSITITIAADNTADALSHVPIMNGCGKGYGGLPTGVTISIPNGMTYAELQDSWQKTPVNLKRMTFVTADTAEVYGSFLQRSKVGFNGIAEAPQEIFLADYADSGDTGYLQTCKVLNQGFLVSPRDVLTVPVKAEGSTRVTFEWDYEEEGVPIPAPGN